MRADASSAPFIAPALTAMWAGSAGALVFALTALVALASALAGSRFGEIVVLRAMGVPPRIQASARFAELAVTVGTAVVAGVLVGALTAAVTARELARAAVAGTPDVLTAALAVDWGPWLIGILAFVVIASAIALVAARAVRRLASRPGLREEER
jgi:ABC-type antimicrobial peptide transport system permease subunit